MNYQNVLVTGGAGFVGSSIAMEFRRRHSGTNVIALDNLKRRGSELNVSRLASQGVTFIHGDVRTSEDIAATGRVDLIVDCSAEPSVLAGYGDASAYVVDTNLGGTANCLEHARRCGADIVFLSTSRVYPVDPINALDYTEENTRFELAAGQQTAGVSKAGIGEDFPLLGASRSLYGATKLASELLVQEYIAAFGIRGIVNRCGVLAGPWQMGKVDQGVTVLWTARHVFDKPLKYIGFGGSGKQVRDVLHIDDLIDLLAGQLEDIESYNGHVYNVGGGHANSVSLLELTAICEKITGHSIDIASETETRPGDVKYYVSDCSRIMAQSGWRPRRSVEQIVEDIYEWLRANQESLAGIL